MQTIGHTQAFLKNPQEPGKQQKQTRSEQLTRATLASGGPWSQVSAFVGDRWNRTLVALMFGSSGAVYAFNRVSRSILRIRTNAVQ